MEQPGQRIIENTDKRRMKQNSWELSSGCEVDKGKHNLRESLLKKGKVQTLKKERKKNASSGARLQKLIHRVRQICQKRDESFGNIDQNFNSTLKEVN